MQPQDVILNPKPPGQLRIGLTPAGVTNFHLGGHNFARSAAKAISKAGNRSYVANIFRHHIFRHPVRLT